MVLLIWIHGSCIDTCKSRCLGSELLIVAEGVTDHVVDLLILQGFVRINFLEAVVGLVVDVHDHLEIAVVHCVDRLGHNGPDSAVLLGGSLTGSGLAFRVLLNGLRVHL